MTSSDDPNAEAAVKKLLSEFSGNRYKPRAIHDTAWEYRKSGNYGRANELDQYVIDNWPADVQVMWAKMDMAKTDIGLGNDAAAEKTIDILITDFNDNPELPTAIFMLGEQYYNKAFVKENEGLAEQAKDHFQKAIAIWERIVTELPESVITPQAYNFSAVCYRKLGEHIKAVEYFQKVVDDWPAYQYAWNAQFLIASCYEKLASSGQMPTADAAVQICRACDKVLANYPDCMAVEAARNLLNRWNSVNSQYKGGQK